jgi:hypothetical protein
MNSTGVLLIQLLHPCQWRFATATDTCTECCPVHCHQYAAEAHTALSIKHVQTLVLFVAAVERRKSRSGAQKERSQAPEGLHRCPGCATIAPSP